MLTITKHLTLEPYGKAYQASVFCRAQSWRFLSTVSTRLWLKALPNSPTLNLRLSARLMFILDESKQKLDHNFSFVVPRNQARAKSFLSSALDILENGNFFAQKRPGASNP
jgi:hypothetical protein